MFIARPALPSVVLDLHGDFMLLVSGFEKLYRTERSAGPVRQETFNGAKFFRKV